MTFTFFGTPSQATTVEDEGVPSQAQVAFPPCLLLGQVASPTIDGGDEWGGLTDGHEQIDREITKLKEDSARDVQRQLEQQRSAARESSVEEGVKMVAEDVEEGIAPVWKAAEQEVDTLIKDAEVDVRGFRKRVESAEAS